MKRRRQWRQQRTAQTPGRRHTTETIRRDAMMITQLKHAVTSRIHEGNIIMQEDYRMNLLILHRPTHTHTRTLSSRILSVTLRMRSASVGFVVGADIVADIFLTGMR